MDEQEFLLAWTGYKERTEAHLRHDWARTQRLAYAVVMPYMQKGRSLKYSDVLISPFDDKQEAQQKPKKATGRVLSFEEAVRWFPELKEEVERDN